MGRNLHMPPIKPSSGVAPSCAPLEATFDAAKTTEMLAQLSPSARHALVGSAKHAVLFGVEAELPMCIAACPVLTEKFSHVIIREAREMTASPKVEAQLEAIRSRALKCLPPASSTRAKILARLEEIARCATSPQAGKACFEAARAVALRTERPLSLTLDADALAAFRAQAPCADGRTA